MEEIFEQAMLILGAGDTDSNSAVDTARLAVCIVRAVRYLGDAANVPQESGTDVFSPAYRAYAAPLAAMYYTNADMANTTAFTEGDVSVTMADTPYTALLRRINAEAARIRRLVW